MTTQDPRTWTFREDEGGTTSITFWAEEGSVEIQSGPDCDGTTSNRLYQFYEADGLDGHDLGVHYRNRSYRDAALYEIWVEDPDNAAFKFATDELGSALICGKQPLTSPEL